MPATAQKGQSNGSAYITRPPSETSIPGDEDAKNGSRESFDGELKLKLVAQDKSAVVNNWLNSKICGKAC